MGSRQPDGVDERIRRRLTVFAAGVSSVFALYFMVRRVLDNSLDATALFIGAAAVLTGGTALWVHRKPSSRQPLPSGPTSPARCM